MACRFWMRCQNFERLAVATMYKTPGVYINELNAFPNSVVEVPTAVPAFFGYTETAPTPNVPTRISSLAEYLLLFGGAPKTKFTYTKGGTVAPVAAGKFLLYPGIRLFFDNGGGPCWIVSVGTADADTTKKKDDFLGALTALEKIQEPTILVAPDAVLLDRASWQEVCQQMIAHCAKMQSRVSILDVYSGDVARTNNDSNDVITLFRNAVTDSLNYAQTYYPWVKTSVYDDTDVDFSRFDDSISVLKSDLDDEAKKLVPDAADPKQKALLTLNALLIQAATGTQQAKPDAGKQPEQAAAGTASTPTPTPSQVHRSLWQVSPLYKSVLGSIKDILNVQPPSAAMAGVYARVDAKQGVFKAPANTGINSVLSPTVNISSEEQEDLNSPLDGKAVNAIRAFVGRGVLVWGARTLDGNSQDWRYINVRRTIIMLEQSIKFASLAYVFEPNTPSTWVTVRNMISNFLTNQWKAGALFGAKPEEAYNVDVGLGSTMTGNDILDGYMRVTVKVALVRPAEFIVLTFQQKMQTS
ncbi:MAG TPA: phage tail sheath C-terminal domain-containing protein [Terracidiphilus sp.]